MRSLRFALLTCAPLALLASACTVYTEPRPAYVEVTSGTPAVDIESYPHTWYDGRVVYLVNDRWYYRDGDGAWAYYHREPEPLYRTRRYVQQAPPAPRALPAPQVAPPAVRVR